MNAYVDPMKFWVKALRIPIPVFLSAISSFVRPANDIGGKKMLQCIFAHALSSGQPQHDIYEHVILQTARIYNNVIGKEPGWRSVVRAIL